MAAPLFLLIPACYNGVECLVQVSQALNGGGRSLITLAPGITTICVMHLIVCLCLQLLGL